MNRSGRLAALAALPLLTAACDDVGGGAGRSTGPLMTGPLPPPMARPVRLTDVTSSCGLEMVLTSGRSPSTQIVEFKGGGLGLVDYDGDGLLDVFVPNGATMDDPERGPGCRLWRNLGDLRFRDVTAEAGLTFRRWGVGLAVGDVDGDGHEDLYVTCYGRNALLRNTGDGRFEDVTDRSGVGDEGWGTGAAFGDLDGDGDLDLYVANYLELDVRHPPGPQLFNGVQVPTGPRSLTPQADVLYENLGDGTFRDATEASGCRTGPAAYGLGVVMLDLDDDGRLDILVGNDSTPNFLFVNRGGLRFEERGVASGIAFNSDGAKQATMGIAIGDVDGDDRPDVFTTNFASDTNTLHLNRGGLSFVDVTHRLGLGMDSFAFLGWACAFHDLNHDGSEDLLIFNGHIYPNATPQTMQSDYLQTPLLFARDGRRFVRLTAASAGEWLDEPHCDRSAAFGDLDRDGDVDVVVGELNGPVRVLRNDVEAGRWLVVRPAGVPFGSRIDLRAGEQRQVRWIFSGGGFLSASAPEAHFGLPGSVESVELTVTFPDGHRRMLADVPVNQRLVVQR